MQAFQPTGDTVNIGLSASSQPLTLPNMGDVSSNIVITNIGTQTLFFKLGNSAVTVTASNGMPIIANTSRPIARGDATTIAVIGAAGSTVYVTAGLGT